MTLHPMKQNVFHSWSLRDQVFRSFGDSLTRSMFYELIVHFQRLAPQMQMSYATEDSRQHPTGEWKMEGMR